MKNYLITIITVAICIGVYNVISPISNGIEKYANMIGMLVLLCVIASPIKDIINVFDENGFDNIKNSIIDSNEDFDNAYDEIFKEYLNNFSMDEAKREIQDILLEKYEIPNGESEILLFTKQESGNLQISKMQILLSGKSVFKNPYTIEEYFEGLLNCTCEVLIK